jgi:hypothetical protein
METNTMQCTSTSGAAARQQMVTRAMKSRSCSGSDSLLSAADRLRAQAHRRDASVDELRWRSIYICSDATADS